MVQSPAKKFSRCISGPGCGACIGGGLAGLSLEDCCARKVIPTIATSITNPSIIPALRTSKFLLVNLLRGRFPQTNGVSRRILYPRERPRRIGTGGTSIFPPSFVALSM
jgi:hypothetical protein